MKLKVLYSLFLCIFLPLKSAEIGTGYIFNDFDYNQVTEAIQAIKLILIARKFDTKQNKDVFNRSDKILAEGCQILGYKTLAHKFTALSENKSIDTIPNDEQENASFLNLFEEELDNRTIRDLNLLTEEIELPGAVEEIEEQHHVIQVHEPQNPKPIRTASRRQYCVIL